MKNESVEVRIHNDLLDEHRLTKTEKAILTVIDSLYKNNPDGIPCFASNKFLASICGCSVPFVVDTIDKLIELHYLTEVKYNDPRRYLKSNLGNMPEISEDEQKTVKVTFHCDYYEELQKFMQKKYEDNVERKTISDYDMKEFFDSIGMYYVI